MNMQNQNIAKIKDILKNVKITKEKNKDGGVTGFIVSVNQGGYYTKQRFDVHYGMKFLLLLNLYLFL